MNADQSFNFVPALFASAEQSLAAALVNNDNITTLWVYNAGSGGGSTGTVIVAQGSGGTCTISAKGDTSCTGALKSAVKANTGDGAEAVETYAVQSAENWFEDAGSGELVNGVARVNLEPLFGQTVNTGIEYHVLLTPDGDCNGLYVTNKTATGFEVHELSGGRSSIAFEYRIMAKRVGHETERLVHVTLPKAAGGVESPSTQEQGAQ